jgi:hypothetical protein
MIEVSVINATPLEDIHLAARATKGKLCTKLPSYLLKYSMRVLEAEHSTLHQAVIRIIDYACRSDVCSQLVRHTDKMPRHYVQSHRPDWTGEPRPKDPAATRIYVSTWPVDALLVMARQRLCHLAMKETREKVLEWKHELKGVANPGSQSEVLCWSTSLAMVPSCVYRAGCPEGKRTCGWWDKNKSKYLDKDIQERWLIYDESVHQISSKDI